MTRRRLWIEVQMTLLGDPLPWCVCEHVEPAGRTVLEAGEASTLEEAQEAAHAAVERLTTDDEEVRRCAQQ